MTPKIILCDLDGTLLSSDKIITERNAAALAECRARGMLVGFSTSRGRSNVIQYERQIKPDILICNGGASLVYKDELLYARTFTLQETQKILDAAYSVCGANVEITLDTLDSVFWNRGKDRSVDYAWESVYSDFKKFSIPAMKVCVQTDKKENAMRIASAVPDCDFLPFSDIPWYKFSAHGVTKENAVKFLCSHLSVSCDDIIAFGDDFNDLEMLKMCGMGVAMGNAIDKVKASSDAVTLSNDMDGVADFLEKNIL